MQVLQNQPYTEVDTICNPVRHVKLPSAAGIVPKYIQFKSNFRNISIDCLVEKISTCQSNTNYYNGRYIIASTS